MIKPTLLVLAAGMGSRYGGLKQLDSIGPSGETIMDYSIYDAIRAGFGKVVFVIRKDFEADFREKVLSKYNDHIKIEIVFQDLTALPAGVKPNPERVKPWGTNHAIMMGVNVTKEPFAVINADDFYGYDSFQILGKALTEMAGGENKYCMVGFRVGNTLSENGEVSRGVCELSAESLLTDVTERHKIKRRDGEVSYIDSDESVVAIDQNRLVSMNMWGFTPDYFEHSEKEFIDFLNINKDELKAEFYIPSMVNKLINDGTSTVKVYDTSSLWFGVTYADDKPNVMKQINALVEKGEYPNKLF